MQLNLSKSDIKNVCVFFKHYEDLADLRILLYKTWSLHHEYVLLKLNSDWQTVGLIKRLNIKTSLLQTY